MDSVNLVSPGNGTGTGQCNDTINFTFNYTGDDETASCILYVTNSTNDFVAVGENSSVSKGTNTVLKSNNSIAVGIRQWCVNCTNSTTVHSDIWTLNVTRHLNIWIVKPTGTQGFLDGDLINISGYVDDECGRGVEGVTLDPSSGTQRYILVGAYGYPTSYCTANWQEGEGWYNCSWDSSTKRRCKWDITMSVDKDYYAPNSTTEVAAFHLGTAPWLSEPGVSPGIEGWGHNFKFYVNFGDADRNSNSISLWKSLDNVSWDFVDMEENKISSSTTITFYERFTCGDSLPSPGKMYYYKFNTTDPYGFTDEVYGGTFNLTEDSVSLIKDSSSSNSVSMLIENATLKFRIRDDDYSYQNPNGSYYPDGLEGFVWITTDGENYTEVLNCTSNNGYCEVSYNLHPLFSTYGTQYWKAGINNNTCYEDENSTAWSFEVTPIRTGRIYPHAAVNGSKVDISISASNYEALWANVTLPNSSAERITLTNNVNYGFNKTDLVGRYNVTFYANDSSGEIVNGSDYFETFVPVVFNVSVADYNSSGVNSTVTFYYRDENISMNSSGNGSYSTEITNCVLDMEVKGYSDRLKVLLKGINISSENGKTFGMDKHTSIGDYLVTYGINNAYNITNASVKIYYDDTSYSDEGNLKLHKCDKYNFISRTCTGSWTDITSNAMQNATNHHFSLNVTSFSGFSIMQYVAPSGPGGSSSPDETPILIGEGNESIDNETVDMEVEEENKTVIERVCILGFKECEGNELWECSADGMEWSLKEICEYGCENGECKEKPEELGLLNYTWIIALIVIIIVITSIYFSKDKIYSWWIARKL